MLFRKPKGVREMEETPPGESRQVYTTISVLGIVVLAAGLVLLFFTFYLAYKLFQDPSFLLFTEISAFSEGEELDLEAMGVGQMIAPILSQFFTNLIFAIGAIGALYAIASVAAKIAYQGIQLFRARTQR